MVLPKNRSLFVDTSYFVALQNPLDTNYKKAIELAQKLVQTPIPLIISSYIFSEVITVISQRIGKNEGVTAGEMLITDPEITIVQANEFIEKIAWELFKKHRQKNISYVDFTTLAFLKEKKITLLLTFDRTDFSSLQKHYNFRFFT